MVMKKWIRKLLHWLLPWVFPPPLKTYEEQLEETKKTLMKARYQFKVEGVDLDTSIPPAELPSDVMFEIPLTPESEEEIAVWMDQLVYHTKMDVKTQEPSFLTSPKDHRQGIARDMKIDHAVSVGMKAKPDPDYDPLLGRPTYKIDPSFSPTLSLVDAKTKEEVEHLGKLIGLECLGKTSFVGEMADDLITDGVQPIFAPTGCKAKKIKGEQ